MDQGVNHQEEGVISISTTGATYSLVKSKFQYIVM